MTDRLPIADITIDPALQIREALDDEAIADYAAAVGRGDLFPPVTLFKDGEILRLADGFHRVKAHHVAQVSHIHATVFQGDFGAALDYALSSNEKNGRRPTAGDRARAYRLAVEHKRVEPADVDGVQRLLRCSQRWARELTREARTADKAERDAEILRLAAEGKTQRETAKAVGLTPMGVNKVLLVNKRKTSESLQDSADTTGINHGQLGQSSELSEELRQLSALKAEIAAAERHNATNPDPTEIAVRFWVPIDIAIEQALNALERIDATQAIPRCPPHMTDRLMSRWASVSNFLSLHARQA